MTVSVIIPTHDASEPVERAVASAQRADVPTEIVVVDNDDREVRGELAAENVRVVQTQSQPPGHNRNAGLRVATGDYVCFLDADDELVRGGLRDRVTALQRSSAAVAVGDSIRAWSVVDNERARHRVPGKPAASYIRGDWKPALSAMLCEREVFATHGFWEGLSRAQDFHLWARVFADFGAVGVARSVFIYWLDDDQRSRQRIHRRFAAQRKACRQLWMAYPRLREPIRERYLTAIRDEVGWHWRDLKAALPALRRRCRTTRVPAAERQQDSWRSALGKLLGTQPSQERDSGSTPEEGVMTTEGEEP
jgi:glycosyltransferase involved in cell wall biosynthesis